MSTGFLFGHIFERGRALGSTRSAPVIVRVLGLRGHTRASQRGVTASGMGFLPVGNPERPGTIPQGQPSATGGFVVPFSYQGHQTHSEFAGQTRLRFTVARDNTVTGTTRVKEYQVIAMAVPNFTNTEDFLNALAGNWQHFMVPAMQGATEAGLDQLIQKEVFATIRTAWDRVSVIANPDERHHMISIVRIRYP